MIVTHTYITKEVCNSIANVSIQQQSIDAMEFLVNVNTKVARAKNFRRRSAVNAAILTTATRWSGSLHKSEEIWVIPWIQTLQRKEFGEKKSTGVVHVWAVNVEWIASGDQAILGNPTELDSRWMENLKQLLSEGESLKNIPCSVAVENVSKLSAILPGRLVLHANCIRRYFLYTNWYMMRIIKSILVSIRIHTLIVTLIVLNRV